MSDDKLNFPWASVSMAEERTQFFEVVYVQVNGRLGLCRHAHHTLAQARTCAKTLNKPQKVVGWKKEARPQFSHYSVEIAQ